MQAQEVGLVARFNALRDDRHTQALADRNNRVRESRVSRRASDVSNQGTIDFDRVQWEALQRRQRRVAGSKVIDGDPNLQRLELGEDLQRSLDIVDQ